MPTPEFESTMPTTWIQRFKDAIALLCGEVPPDGMAEAWAAHENEGLQSWALNRCPLPWCMGITVVEAAEHLADQPEEGIGHHPRENAGTHSRVWTGPGELERTGYIDPQP